MNRNLIWTAVLLGSIAIFGALSMSAASPRGSLVIHEWGTFTVLQDEHGRALPGVNVNEESLPSFVHNLSPALARDSREYSAVLGKNYARSKKIPRSYPLAFMRMETPIVYFYPPEEDGVMKNVDLEVRFRNGWISEWYPEHTVIRPEKVPWETSRIRLQDGGRIEWKGLTLTPVGAEPPASAPPRTTSNVWLAPRKVRSAMVTTKKGNSEKYLFYRGIANLRAPLEVTRSDDSLSIRSNFPDHTRHSIRSMYLVDTRTPGKVGFRRKGHTLIPKEASGRVIWKTPAKLESTEYGTLDALWKVMKKDLVADGLFEDEAEAMLQTWKFSYFESPGLRVFFTLPQSWTDHALPMDVNREAEITRVMIGRIELVTPAQRKLLAEIAKAEVSTPAWFSKAIQALPADERDKAYRDIAAGTRTLESLGAEIPKDYQAYMKLGRFRDALILHAARAGGSDGLDQFAANYGLNYFKPLTRNQDE